MCDLNNNVDWNDEYILIAIFVRARSTRFRISRGTRIPCATRFRNASIHIRPTKAARQHGPYFQNFLTRELEHTSAQFPEDEFSEDAQAPFFMRVHLSSGFHPGLHPIPSDSIRLHPGPSDGFRCKSSKYSFLPSSLQAQSRFGHKIGVHRLFLAAH